MLTGYSKDVPDPMKKLRSTEEAEQLKAAHYGRIEVELQGGEPVAIDALSDAYSPAL